MTTTPVTAPSCGLLGCDVSERLQRVVEEGHLLLPGTTPDAPPPPPEPWFAGTTTWAVVVLVVLAVAGVVAVRRSPRLRELVRDALAAVKVQVQPARIARWSGPLGRAALAVAAGSWRFITAGRTVKAQAWRAGALTVAVLLFIGTPFGVAGIPLRALSAFTHVPVPLIVVGIVGLLVAVVIANRDEQEDATGWWSERRLVAALVAAGVLPTVREGEPRHVLRRRGQPVHDPHGTTVTFSLPGARPWGAVQKARDRIAAALSLDVELLFITHPAGQPTDVVTMQVVSSSRPARPPAVAAAERTDWSSPVVLGLDAQGREVLFTTGETHTVIAGATGSGKTALARAVVAHAALDPRVRLYGIDGKGDAGSKGWQALEPRCELFVRGMGPDAPARIEALLTEVYELAQQRGAAGQEDPEVLLILEEWATCRTVLRRLDAACADRCDALVTVLLATARSRGVHVLLIVQRGTATAFPVDQRANCGQRIVGKFGDSAEAGYVLESLPSRLPSRAGEFAVSLDGKAPALVMADYLEPPAWEALCRRAVAMRATAPTVAAEPERSPFARPLPPEPVEAAPEPEPVVLDPLVHEVLAVLADADPRGLPAAALLERLPAYVRPPSPAALGRALRAHPEAVRAGHVQGGARVWRAVVAASSAPAGTVVVPSSHRLPAVVEDGNDGSGGALHAQTGPAVALPSSPSSPAGAR